MSVLSTGEMVRTGPRPTSPCPFFLTHRKVGGGLASAEQVRVTDSWSSTKGEADDETTVTLGGTGGRRREWSPGNKGRGDKSRLAAAGNRFQVC